MAYGSNFYFSSGHVESFFVFQLIFQSIVFCEVDSCIYMQVLFLDII